MSKRYKTGARDEVLHFMMECAVRDRITLAQAYGAPLNLERADKETKKVVADCEDAISDFRKLAKSMRSNRE